MISKFKKKKFFFIYFIEMMINKIVFELNEYKDKYYS